MKRITVLNPFGHKLVAEEVEACLVALHRAGIPAHLGTPEHGYNIISFEVEEDAIHAATLLRAHGFKAMALP
jgi:hypothetical protein